MWAHKGPYGRWPFQKKVAVEVDQLQVHMIAIISGIRRLSGETSTEWYKRRGRAAKTVAGRIGFGSEIWANRVIKWNDHVARCPKNYHSGLLNYKNEPWLIARRLLNVPRISIGTAGNTPEAGRTGTRIWSGRPQPRWDAGVRLAKQLINTRSRSLRGSQPLGVGSRIREAKKYLTEFFSLTSRTPG